MIFTASESYEGDFRAFYVAGQAARHHLNPYRNNSDSGPAYVDAFDDVAASRFIYPPGSLFLFSPLSRLSYRTARLAFANLSLLLLAAILVYLADRYNVENVWVVMAFLSLPVMASLDRGQIDILILALLMATFVLRRSAFSGLPLGLAISIKVFPVAMLLWLIATKKYRAALVAVLTTLLVALATVKVFAVNSFGSFLANLRNTTPTYLSPASSENLKHVPIIPIDGQGLLATHGYVGGGNNPLSLFGAWGTGAGLLCFLILAYLVFRQRPQEDVSYFSFLLIAQVMNPILWTTGIVMFIPLCLLAIGRLKSMGIACALMLPLWLPSQLHIHDVGPRLLLAVGLVFYVLGQTSTEKGETHWVATEHATSA